MAEMSKRLNLKKREIILLIIILALALCTVALSVLSIVTANQKAETLGNNYYDQKCAAFVLENRNYSEGQIVFIGDSITDGYRLDDYYADLPIATYNRGISGDVTHGVINRIQGSIFDIKPSKVVLMIGTNDVNFGKTNEEIVENYITILDKTKQNLPSAELYFMSVIPQNKDFISNAGEHNEQIQNLNIEIKSLAESYGYTYIDLYNNLLDDDGYLSKELSDDGLHLNGAGYEVWTSLLKPHFVN